MQHEVILYPNLWCISSHYITIDYAIEKCSELTNNSVCIELSLFIGITPMTNGAVTIIPIRIPHITNVSALTNILVMKEVVVKLTLSQTLASEKEIMFELFLSTLNSR